MSRGGLIAPLPPLGPRAARARSARELPFPLGEASLTLFNWGRTALHAGIRAQGVGPGDEVLAPAYHHGSEIEAIARTGATVRFYSGSDELEPDPGELESLLGPKTRALHVTHYLGFPQRMSRWRAWCDDRGLVLIEDAAQAWLGSDGARPLGSFGDVAMFCLYKIAPLPDGGAVVSSPPAQPPPARASFGVARAAKGAAAWLAQRSPALSRAVDRARDPAALDRDAAVELGAAAPPARITTTLLGRLDYARIRSRRRANYAYLLGRLGPYVARPFDALPAGAAPWLFPVWTSNKAGLLAELEGAGILATDLWAVGHRLLDRQAGAATATRRQQTVGLPVHQELREPDLARIADAAEDWFAHAAAR